MYIHDSRINDLSLGRSHVWSSWQKEMTWVHCISDRLIASMPFHFSSRYHSDVDVNFAQVSAAAAHVRMQCKLQHCRDQRRERQLENSVTREWHLQSILMGNLKKWSRVSGEQGRGVLRYRYNEKWEKWEWEVRTETLSAVEWKDHQAWTRLSCSGCQYRKN